MSLLGKIKDWLADHMIPIAPIAPIAPIKPTNTQDEEDEEECKNKQ